MAGVLTRRAFLSSYLKLAERSWSRLKSPLPYFSPLTKTPFHSTETKFKKEMVKVTFVSAEGERINVEGKEGDTLLDVVVNNNLDFDGFGACEGTLACSTCHVLMSKEDYSRLPDKPSDEELDMLDLAYGLSETSRLGCQIVLKKEYDGIEIKLPSGKADARQR